MWLSLIMKGGRVIRDWQVGTCVWTPEPVIMLYLHDTITAISRVLPRSISPQHHKTKASFQSASEYHLHKLENLAKDNQIE